MERLATLGTRAQDRCSSSRGRPAAGRRACVHTAAEGVPGGRRGPAAKLGSFRGQNPSAWWDRRTVGGVHDDRPRRDPGIGWNRVRAPAACRLSFHLGPGAPPARPPPDLELPGGRRSQTDAAVLVARGARGRRRQVEPPICTRADFVEALRAARAPRPLGHPG